MPELPTCSEMTVSVSAHASMIGSQWSRSHSDGSPIACGRSGNVTDVNPRAALRRISPAATRGVGEIRDAERHDAVGMALVPLLEQPVVPRAHAREPELAVVDAEEHAAAEPGDLRREVHRRPHAVDVHVAHAGVDVVATGAHLVEAERLELHRLRAAGRPPRSSRPACSARPRTPRPGGPCGSRRSCGAAVLQRGGEPPLERVRRLDDVVVDRDHGVLHRRAAPAPAGTARRRGHRQRRNCRASQSSWSRTHCFATRRVGRDDVEPVARARVDVQLRRHARVVQPQRVVDVLVAEAVDGADGDERGRQSRQVGGPRRRRGVRARRRGRRDRRGTTATRTRSSCGSTRGARPADSSA